MTEHGTTHLMYCDSAPTEEEVSPGALLIPGGNAKRNIGNHYQHRGKLQKLSVLIIA